MIGRFTTAVLIVCVVCFCMLACGKSAGITPSQTPDDLNSVLAPGHQCWGTWDVAINAETGEVQTVPLRTADFNASVVRFLQPPIAPIELVKIALDGPESNLPKGLAALDITLRHPFPAVSVYRGFDVRGIILSDAGRTGQHDTGVRYFGATGTHLLNPDGFTRWWNQPEFTSYGTIFGYTEGHFAKQGFTTTTTLNPYKLHTPGLGNPPTIPVYQLDPSTRATFPAVDGIVTRRYRVQFDTTLTPIFRFKYSVDASWSLPNASFKPTYPIQAYDSKANCQEPYLVYAKSFEEIPYYVDQWVSGGRIKMLLTIGDWQATGGNVLNEISHVWIESPTLFPTPIDVRNTMEFVETTTPTQATYRISVDKAYPKALDGQIMIVTVESKTPDTFKPQIDGDTSKFVYPSAPLAAYDIIDVPITNLAPQGAYAYVYFIPDWCGTMRHQCADDADNQKLMRNIMSQDIDGYYNDFTHVKLWEGKSNTQGQEDAAFHESCTALGYSYSRSSSPTFDATGCRAIVVLLWRMDGAPLNPPFTEAEANAMKEYIQNGGILFYMCEASGYFNNAGLAQLFEWMGMLMEYGGGATPEWTDGYTTKITPHAFTAGMKKYHYYTCGTWITQDPHVMTLIQTEVDEKLVLMYPIPLE